MSKVTRSSTLSNYWRFSLPAVAMFLFLFIYLLQCNMVIFSASNAFAKYIDGDFFLAHITVMGDTLLLFAVLGLLVQKYPSLIYTTLLSAVISALVVHALKFILDIPRPVAVLGLDNVHVIGIPLFSHAFPSGHTASAFTFAAVLIAFVPSAHLRWLILLTAGLVGFSRIAVGAHWPMDVLAGAPIGWLGGMSGVYLYDRWWPQTLYYTNLPIVLMLLTCALWLGLGYTTHYNVLLMQYILAMAAVVNLTICLILTLKRRLNN